MWSFGSYHAVGFLYPKILYSMKNIEKLANHIAKNGPDGMLVHTIPGTSNWIICQKIDEDKWMLTLADPMGDVTFNLGTVSDKDHTALWIEITRMEIENKVSQIKQSKKLTIEDEKVRLEKKMSRIDSENESKD